MRILVVDDSKPFQIAMQAILASSGYHDVTLASSAFEAIATVQNQNNDEQFDLILMDVVMPNMNGIDAVKTLKTMEQLEDVPILMVSAQDEEENVERAFEAGATDFINKPIKRIELRARIRAALRLREEMRRRKEHQEQLAMLNASLEAANRQLLKLSNTDGLTGIPNRRYFDQALQTEWQRAQRSRGNLSCVMADIDFFKAYNDYYGHLEGDSCLRQVADVIAKSLRRPADHAARYGGEEFVALLPDTDETGALEVAGNIQRRLEELGIPHLKSSVKSTVTVSMGIATVVPGKQYNPASLVDAADQALYQAKNSGRNRIMCGMVSPVTNIPEI